MIYEKNVDRSYGKCSPFFFMVPVSDLTKKVILIEFLSTRAFSGIQKLSKIYFIWF